MGSIVNVQWPPKHEVLGVAVSAATYDTAVDAVIHAAGQRQKAIVSLHAVHALVTASRDPALREAVNQFQMVAPDGQPVRWALNRLYGTGLRDRVYGPELMLRLCREAESTGVSVYLYGSSEPVMESLCRELRSRYPGLAIAGTESPPYRPLTSEEDEEVVQRINASGAGIVFIGLGAPKQDLFAHAHRGRIEGVQVCVGAAFDFHAGSLKMAPPWMQQCGLEWLYRLLREPRRLWRRYLVTNSLFVAGIGTAMTRRFCAGIGQPRKCRLKEPVS
ncbi:MAG: WecB/TagA/CpsF family glycosyltransferase [Thermoguttaceae bacterium]